MFTSSQEFVSKQKKCRIGSCRVDLVLELQTHAFHLRENKNTYVWRVGGLRTNGEKIERNDIHREPAMIIYKVMRCDLWWPQIDINLNSLGW